MDGDIRESQLRQFVKELQNAPEDKALIVAVHHPAYSADITCIIYKDTITEPELKFHTRWKTVEQYW
jgi:hypothetical protein